MAQHYYDKFMAISNTSYVEPGWASQGSDFSVRYADLAKSYSWNPSTGKFTVNSDFYASGTTVPTGAIGYRLLGTVLYRYSKTDGSSLAEYSSNASASTKDSNSASTNTNYSKGSLVQAGIAAEDGTYPANGRHTDGYWYVKGALVATNAGEVATGSTWSLLNPVSKKLVRLDNGWLLAAMVYPNNYIYLMLSKDNGVTWTLKGSTSNGAVRDISLISVGNDAVFSFSNGSSIILYKWESATEGAPVYLGQLGGTASIMEFGISFFWDATRKILHVAYSQTYGASYAIYYAKITNNLQTFGTPKAIGPMNTSGLYHTTPTVLVDVSKGYVYLIARYVSSSNHTIVASRSTNNGDTFTGFNYSIYGGVAGWTCDYPHAVIDSYGRLHTVLQYTDATNTTLHTMYKYSEDGINWVASTTQLPITNNMMYPVLTVDKGNNVFIFGTTGNDQNIVLYTSSDRGVNWSQTAKSVKTNARHPQPLYDPTFKLTFGVDNIMPIIYRKLSSPTGVYYEGQITTNNKPTIAIISPENNRTLYENDVLNISGDAYDADKDQSVTVFYQIDSEQRKVLATNISQTQITLSKQLTFKDSKLFDGETVLTGTLTEGVAHTLKVWAVDSENGQSATIERTFYVVPNRAPLLSVDAVVPSGIINTDKFKISGTASDQDANSNIKVNYRINGANPVEVYNGAGGAWEFEVSLAQLVVNENTIIIEVIDNYDAKTSKTIKLNKNEVKTPILQSVARYKISPPKGSARGVLIWVQRDEDLDLKVELSMTLIGEQEQFILLELDPDKIVPVTDGIVEDEYYHETVEPKDNIILKLTTTRPNINIDNKVYLIMGVVE